MHTESRKLKNWCKDLRNDSPNMIIEKQRIRLIGIGHEITNPERKLKKKILCNEPIYMTIKWAYI